MESIDEIIARYQAKLDFANKAIETTRLHLSEEELDMMNDCKLIMENVIADFNSLKKPVLTKSEISDKAYEASQKRIINLHAKFFIEGYEQCLNDIQK